MGRGRLLGHRTLLLGPGATVHSFQWAEVGAKGTGWAEVGAKDTECALCHGGQHPTLPPAASPVEGGLERTAGGAQDHSGTPPSTGSCLDEERGPEALPLRPGRECAGQPVGDGGGPAETALSGSFPGAGLRPLHRHCPPICIHPEWTQLLNMRDAEIPGTPSI